MTTGACSHKKQVAEETLSLSAEAKQAIDSSVEYMTQISDSVPKQIANVISCKDQMHSYKINTKRMSQSTMKMLNEKITSGYVALYDVTTDEIIFSKNYNKKCFPASTTKILTAITACKIIQDPDTIITVGKEIRMIDPESSTADLTEGMQLTFEMLMSALMLPSGNDAAYTMAVTCGRIYQHNPSLSEEQALKVFMEQVNVVAAQIGASHTHFVTPDGIHDDKHYTSAEDLIKIADYAMTIPLIKETCRKTTVKWTLPHGGTVSWDNNNKMLLEGSGVFSPFCDGIKTGFTDEAGTSVVTSATIDGHTFIAVAMKGETVYAKYDDCNLLFQEGFKLYKKEYTYG